MVVTVLNSGSDGNCYLLECDGEILVLDCGVPLIEVKKALHFDLSRVVGCFISHAHGDHAKYRKEYERIGVDVFTPYDLENAVRINRKIGGYELQAFRVPHGETVNFGVLIAHKSGQRILYATDFEYILYSFKACRINHFLIECNYQPEYVDLDAPNKEHKIRGHASLETCRKFVETNKTEHLKSVLLIHLGKSSTNPNECVDAIKAIVSDKVMVDYAKPHTTYQF